MAAAVALQIDQVTRDTSLTQDAKVQQINDLAVQFNRLVSQLQQLDCGQACPPAPATAPPAPASAPPATLANPTSARTNRPRRPGTK